MLSPVYCGSSVEWDGELYLEELTPAAALFRQALVYDPHNRTAHHRLGLIAARQRSFDTAVDHLAQARARDPDHRGVVKAPTYSYVWQGDYEAAAPLLLQVPAAAYELSNYKYWWLENGRDDLSQRAVEKGVYPEEYQNGVAQGQ